jgi:DMSO/TMAO reductase YedYZ heme-binding membrane subunit
MSLAVLATAAAHDMRTAEGVAALIAYSVRWSVPWLFLAFAASALHQLVRNQWSQWLLRNRRIIGLCFASGMAWQVLFILTLLAWHRDYYVNEVYVLRDAIEGVVGYVFLIAMTLTSFTVFRRRLTPGQWRQLHTWGIYILWAYAFSVYWHELFYYDDPDWVDYVYYVAGLLAWACRLAAWGKRQLAADTGTTGHTGGSIAGGVLLALAVVGVVSGAYWEGAAYTWLWDTTVAHWLELYMPYWPFIPFFPLLIAIPGAWLLARSGRARPAG